jgi:hypothetical protein
MFGSNVPSLLLRATGCETRYLDTGSRWQKRSRRCEPAGPRPHGRGSVARMRTSGNSKQEARRIRRSVLRPNQVEPTNLHLGAGSPSSIFMSYTICFYV